MNEPTNILQAKVEAAAADVFENIGGRCAVTLIGFYNNGRSEGAGFASTLPLEMLLGTLECRVTAICGAPQPIHDASGWLPDQQLLEVLAARCRTLLPFASAFSLILGAGPHHKHASFIAPTDLLAFYSETLIPQVRAQVIVAAAEPPTQTPSEGAEP